MSDNTSEIWICNRKFTGREAERMIVFILFVLMFSSFIVGGAIGVLIP